MKAIKSGFDRRTINKLGIFASSLLITAVAFYVYSPIIGTNATETEVADINVENNPVISLNLSTNLLSFNLTPASTAFDSKPITATVRTNSTGGYELYFSSVDNQTDMVNSDQNISDVITSNFNGTVTSATMGSNAWGYSLDNTDFSKIPTLNNHEIIKNLAHLPTSSENSTTTNIGIKIDNTLTSGTYSKNILFSAVAHASLVPDPVYGIHSIKNMQEMTPQICADTTTPTTSATDFDWDGSKHNNSGYVPRTTLTDTRDNNVYLVSKLADGNCWMSQNLALDLTAGTPVIVSNNDGTTKTVIPYNTTQTAVDTNWLYNNFEWRSYHPQSGESYYQGGEEKSSTPSGQGYAYNWEKAGNYYNWYTATAESGTSTLTSGEAGSSLCPKGWRLPSNSGTKSLANLITTTYGVGPGDDVSSVLADPLNFILSGRYNGAGSGQVDYAMYDQEVYGYYRTSTAYYSPNSYMLVFGAQSGVVPTPYIVGAGLSIRCVAI